jgi:hypothetical protein
MNPHRKCQRASGFVSTTHEYVGGGWGWSDVRSGTPSDGSQGRHSCLDPSNRKSAFQHRLIPICTVLLVTALSLLSVSTSARAAEEEQSARPTPFRAVLLSASQVTEARLRGFQTDGYQACVLELRGRDRDETKVEQRAVRTIRDAGLELYYWIEIARNAELADAQPLWMGSLQGHQQWRRLFPKAPQVGDGEIVKVYPWVPILYEEAFDAHLARVKRLLADHPAPAGILLNDLQGAPSACGCGNTLCRWTTDYGPIRTATPLDDNAAARFVAAVGRLAPESRIVPVWTTECEEHDGAKDGFCAGVGCFKGICWKAYTKQLTPLAQQSDTIGVLLPYQDLGRDMPIYGRPAGWITHALETFQQMPLVNNAQPIPAQRLIAVLQGWDVTDEQIETQIARAQESGAAGYVVSHTRIEQSWEPRIVKRDKP